MAPIENINEKIIETSQIIQSDGSGFMLVMYLFGFLGLIAMASGIYNYFTDDNDSTPGPQHATDHIGAILDKGIVRIIGGALFISMPFIYQLFIKG